MISWRKPWWGETGWSFTPPKPSRGYLPMSTTVKLTSRTLVEEYYSSEQSKGKSKLVHTLIPQQGYVPKTTPPVTCRQHHLKLLCTFDRGSGLPSPGPFCDLWRRRRKRIWIVVLDFSSRNCWSLQFNTEVKFWLSALKNRAEQALLYFFSQCVNYVKIKMCLGLCWTWVRGGPKMWDRGCRPKHAVKTESWATLLGTCLRHHSSYPFASLLFPPSGGSGEGLCPIISVLLPLSMRPSAPTQGSYFQRLTDAQEKCRLPPMGTCHRLYTIPAHTSKPWHHYWETAVE